jgi:hypothetical protein
MTDRLIVTPDEDLIEELSKEFKKAEPRPETLYVDGHIDLPYYMMNSAPQEKFDDLDQGPVTLRTLRESGLRLFTTSILCQDIYNGEKALSHFKQIAEREGLVGITFNPETLSTDGEAEIEDIFIHMDTVVQKFGPDFIAIGSDFGGFDKFTKGMEDLTGISNLEKIMADHGYKREDMEKILGLNWLRIIEQIL